jgi:hypothetical protein
MKTFLVLFLTGWTISFGFAVDQSKFRTCDQTSFCRRHRGGHSAALYKYRLDKDSVQFHIPSEENDAVKEAAADAAAEAEAKNNAGLWKSLQDRILGGSEDTDSEKDPYFRGTAPTLTGVLVNNVAKTSTSHKEKLELSVHGEFLMIKSYEKLFYPLSLLTLL